MKFLLALTLLVASSHSAEFDCDKYVETVETVCDTCMSCPTLYLTPYMDTFKGLCALNQMGVADHCYDSKTFRVCWKTMMAKMEECGLGEAAENCAMEVPEDLCHDEEGNMRSQYELCELPRLDAAVRRFHDCINMDVLAMCGVEKMAGILPEYECPNPEEMGPLVECAMETCTPASAENPAENVGWYNNKVKRAPKFYRTFNLCVAHQLGFVSIQRRTFTVDIEGLKNTFCPNLYEMARIPALEGDERFGEIGEGVFHRASRFKVNEYFREFVDNIHNLCGCTASA